MCSGASLNHIYRSVWNASLGAVVAVAEISPACSGSGRARGTVVGAKTASGLLAVTGPRALAAALALAFSSVPWVAHANPAGGVAIVGQASMATSGNQLTVTTQNGPGTSHSAINWQSFSIPQGNSTYFQQPNAASTVINRVVTNTPSQIFGTLGSNGSLLLVNQSGITVGAGAVVDTAGFTASALRMSDADALAGRSRFGDEAGAGAGVSVFGNILARSGDVVLLGSQVSTGQDALIQAPNGSTILAAGQQIEITARGLEGITLQVQAPTDQAINLGTLQAGAVGMFAGTLRHSGQIKANTISQEGGKVVLKAMADAYVDGAGNISATGSKGGSVDVFGKRVAIADQALIDVSGAEGGGDVRVGGDYQGKNADVLNADYTYFGPEATIKADAITSGDGGKVIVWADKSTRAYGSITARGGVLGGDGGFVETSGKEGLDFQAKVDVGAVAGKGGTLLLDPSIIYLTGGTLVGAQPLSTISFADTTTNIYQNQIEGLVAGTNVVLEATDYIQTASSFNNDLLTLPVDSSLTLRTRNLLTDVATVRGIDLTIAGAGASGSAPNLLIKTQGSGTITMQTGAGDGSGAQTQSAPIILPKLETVGGLISLSASGSISSGAITTTGLLKTSSVGGASLAGLNAVGSFSAINSGSGDIVFNNTTDLTLVAPSPIGNGAITSITQSGTGAISVTVSGNLSLSGAVVASGGAVSLTTTGDISALSSRLDVSSNGGAVTFDAGGGITLFGDGDQIISSSATNAGAVVMTASGNISVPYIDASGAGSYEGNGWDGGDVSLSSLNGAVTFNGSVMTSGGAALSFGDGGNAGSVTVTASSGISSNSQDIYSQGGSGDGYGGTVGLGGDITLSVASGTVRDLSLHAGGSTNGSVTVEATVGSLEIGRLTAPQTSISVQALQGAITGVIDPNADGDVVHITADNQNIDLQALNGIGDTGPDILISTASVTNRQQAGSLTFKNTENGVYIRTVNEPLVVKSGSNSNGLVQLSAENTSFDGIVLDAAGTLSSGVGVYLTTTGTGGIVGDSAVITSPVLLIDSVGSVSLLGKNQVGTLAATVSGQSSDLYFNNALDLSVGYLTTNNDISVGRDVDIKSTGSVTVETGRTTVDDSGVSVDYSISAGTGGYGGSIELRAGWDASAVVVGSEVLGGPSVLGGDITISSGLVESQVSLQGIAGGVFLYAYETAGDGAPSGGKIDIKAGTSLLRGGNVDIVGASDVTLAGAMTAGILYVDAGWDIYLDQSSLQGGNLTLAGNVTVTDVADDLSAANLYADAGTGTTTGGFTQTSGAVLKTTAVGSQIFLYADRDMNLSGTLEALGSVDVESGGTRNGLALGGNLTLAGSDLSSVSEGVSLYANSGTEKPGSILQTGTSPISIAGAINVGLFAEGDIKIGEAGEATVNGNFGNLSVFAGINNDIEFIGSRFTSSDGGGDVVLGAFSGLTAGHIEVAANRGANESIPTAQTTGNITQSGTATTVVQQFASLYVYAAGDAAWLGTTTQSVSSPVSINAGYDYSANGGYGGLVFVGKKASIGNIDAGVQAVNVKATGGISLEGVSTAGMFNLQAGDGITLGAGSKLTASDQGTAMVLNSGIGSFVNSAGQAALNFAGDGRWLIFAADPSKVAKGGLTSDFRRYGTPYLNFGGSDGEVGNGFVYAQTPTGLVNVALTSGQASHVYGFAPDATFSAVVPTIDEEDLDGTSPLVLTHTPSSADNAGSYNVGYQGGLSTIQTNAYATDANGIVGLITFPVLTGGESVLYTVDQRILTGATIAAVNTTYGTFANAGVVSFDNIVVGDDVTSTASINSPATSSSGNLKVGSYTQTAGALVGADALNYSFSGFTTSTANYTVNPLALTGSISGGGNTYGDVDMAGFAVLMGVLAGDMVFPDNVVIDHFSFTGSSSGNFNAGTYAGAQSVGGTLAGADASNYSFAGATADYTVAQLALTGAAIAAVNTTYGTAASPGAVSFGNIVSGDFVTSTASIDNPVLSSSENLSAGSYTQTAGALGDADALNYSFAGFTTGTANYLVDTLALSVGGIVAANKVYDGNNLAMVSTSTATYSGLVTNDDLTVAATGLFNDKNVADGKTVTLSSGYSGADVNNYTITDQAGTTANVTPKALNISGITAANKVYDGNTGAALTSTGAIFSGAITGDILAVANATGNFTDKNAGQGKTVNISGLTLGGTDAGNYTLASTTASALANVSVRPVSTWLGNNGNWSDAANWDALPDASNVLAVVIPVGATVVYDAAVGTTRLQTLTSSGSLTLAGGALDIADVLSTPQYTQTAGALTGTGALTVNGSFGQSAGTINMGGAVTITQSAGNLAVGRISGASIRLTAPGGAITQTGALTTAGVLEAQSLSGSLFDDAGNRVSAFKAAASAAGNIALNNNAITNPGELDVQGITTASGNITLNNFGAISTSGLVRALNGTLSVTANSPLTVGASGVTATGNINLAATNQTSAGNMTLNGPVTSTAGSINMSAASNFVQNSSVSAAGSVTASAGGSMSFGVGATTVGYPVFYSVGGTQVASPFNPVLAAQTLASSTVIGVTDFSVDFEEGLLPLVFEDETLVAAIASEVSGETSISGLTTVAPKQEKFILVLEGSICTR